MVVSFLPNAVSGACSPPLQSGGLEAGMGSPLSLCMRQAQRHLYVLDIEQRHAPQSWYFVKA